MTLFSRESVLENMLDEEGVASGDESMNTDTEPSDYNESELSGDDQNNQNLFYNSNGNLVSDYDL